MIKVKSQKLVASVLFIFVVAFTLVIFANNARAKYQFETTIKDIEDRIDASLQLDGRYLVNGMPLGLSSNPYDYVKDNAEFQKLVSYGDGILDDLVAMQKDKEKYDSFQRYLLAIAIEEITKTDLKAFDKYMWDEADVFAEKWSVFESDASVEVSKTINNNELTDDEKWSKISKYGTLAISPLKSIQSPENEDLVKKMINMLSTSDRDSVIKIATGEISPPQ